MRETHGSIHAVEEVTVFKPYYEFTIVILDKRIRERIEQDLTEENSVSEKDEGCFSKAASR